MHTELNIPNLKGDKFLIAGAGGGFDVFAGLPLYTELTLRHDDSWDGIVYANYSSQSKGFKVRHATKDDYPEWHMSGAPCYTIGRNGVLDVLDGYKEIVERHKIDTVILVDGGVDSLMRGDEKCAGTILEDFISLAAVDMLDVPNKYLVCLGFGCETEENLNHYRVLENIASLCKTGDFLGSCSLIEKSVAFRLYKDLCEGAWDKGRRKSHIHTRIIPAVLGDFGTSEIYKDIDAQVHAAADRPPFISPLMSIYWFFNLAGVARRNVLLSQLKLSRSFTDAMMVFRQTFNPNRSKEGIPL